MTLDELKQKISPLSNDQLFEVPNFPNFVHSAWKDSGNGARVCVVYTYADTPVATPIILFPGHSDQEAFKMAVERIQHGLYEKENPSAEEGETSQGTDLSDANAGTVGDGEHPSVS